MRCERSRAFDRHPAVAAGGRYPELALALARGERPEPTLGEFREGIVMTRFFSDGIGRVRGALAAVFRPATAPVAEIRASTTESRTSAVKDLPALARARASCAAPTAVNALPIMIEAWMKSVQITALMPPKVV